jgi:hypothetical protein
VTAPRRLVLILAASIALCLLAAACDASPYAAVVDGQTIKTLQLNQVLGEWSANSAVVAAQARAGSPILGDGGPGTYSKSFTDFVLDQLIVADAVHQYLARTGQLPSAQMVAAARGFYEGEAQAYMWYGYPPALRQFLAQSLAEQAVLVAPLADKTPILGYYKTLSRYMFTSICVVYASAFRRDQAEALAASGVPNGARVCFDQASLEAQPPAFRAAALSVGVSQVAAPFRTSFGYEVLKVVSKAQVPFDTDTQKVLSALYDFQNHQQPPALLKVLSSARVKLNPAYGTWQASSASVVPPNPPGTTGQ